MLTDCNVYHNLIDHNNNSLGQQKGGVELTTIICLALADDHADCKVLSKIYYVEYFFQITLIIIPIDR